MTFRQLFKKPITVQYPEVVRPVYPRFRGRHRLHRHENGLEKCVGCSLCAAACPSDCIRVVAAENEPGNRVSAGERYARIYEINMSRCIFCGYCELACPFDAITLGTEYEISEYSRDDLIYTKDILLQPPVKTVPVADPAEYDTPDPLLQDALVTRRPARGLGVGRPRLDRLGRRGGCVPRVRGRRRQLREPLLLGARPDREPRVARRALPAAVRRVRRRCAGADLRRRDRRHVPVRDRLPRRPRRHALAWRAGVAGDRGRRRSVRDPRRGGRRDRHPGAAATCPRRADVSGAFGSPAAIGELFLTDHLLAFEMTSVVLLVAAVGGVILGSHARRADEGEV